MLQRWRAVGNTVSDLTGPRFEPRTSRSKDERVTARPTGRFNEIISITTMAISSIFFFFNIFNEIISKILKNAANGHRRDAAIAVMQLSQIPVAYTRTVPSSLTKSYRVAKFFFLSWFCRFITSHPLSQPCDSYSALAFC